MKPPESSNTNPGPLQRLLHLLLPARGSVLAYMVVVILIFGVLGVIIVSLFTTAATSSATPNDARRVDYIRESAIRIAFSELRNTNFDPDTINDLNSLTYHLEPSGSFSFNVFGPWFDSSAQYDYSGGSTITVTVPEGKIPDGFTIPSWIWLVNYEYVDRDSLDVTRARDPVVSFSKVDDTTLNIVTAGDFHLEPGDRLCLAVKPESTQTINEGDDLLVENTAADVFPAKNGAININRIDYVYEKLVDEGSRARLVNVSASSMPNQLTPFPLTVESTTNAGGTYTGDFIVLSPRNHIVIPSGSVGAVTFTGKLENGVNIYDTFPAQAMTRKPDIEFDQESNLPAIMTEKETDSGFVNIDNTQKAIDIGGGGSASNQFGDTWFNDTRAIGGDTDYCDAGKCLFKTGVRVFFTLAYSGTGEGLTFALLNGALNDDGSAGGDIDLPELMGYGGDSRKISNPNLAPDYLDGTGDGLQPPKIAVEFDARTENSNFQYCNPAGSSDPADIEQNTRNDPLTADRDAVQYVFWGNTSLTIPCRNDKASYDDNRHAAEGPDENPWEATTINGYFEGSGDIRTRPVVVPDDVVYVTTDNGRLHAINLETGTERWTFPDDDPFVTAIGKETTSPAISNDGSTIYFGSWDIDGTGKPNRVWAIHASDGTKKWVFPDSDPAVVSIGKVSESSPAVDKNGVIYIGSSDNNFYAINPDGTQKWAYPAGNDVESDPIVDRTGGAYDGTIYVGQDGGKVLAFDPAGGGIPKWAFDVSSDVETAPVLNKNGSIVYAVDENGRVYAINASDGSPAWSSPVDLGRFSLYNNPVVDLTGSGFDGTIYHVTDDGHLFAVKSDGTGYRWDKYLNANGQSSPAVGPDGAIYVGSDDGYLYAINPADESVVWSMDTGAPVKSDPVFGPDGTVYSGNDDDKVFARNRIARPPNQRDLLITSTDGVSPVRVAGEEVAVDNEVKWLQGKTSALAKGPWAVRLEVMRSDTVNGNGNYEYTLHAWVRQCNESDCSDLLGTFYPDTRIQYATTSERPAHLAQTIELNSTDHSRFYQFLFGFTGAVAAGDTQSAVIDHFQLSFIRPNDPIITSDPDWPPP